MALTTLATNGGCGLRGLSFVQDDRVTILEPRPRASVALPVRLAWRAEGFSADDGSFAVFVDRSPQPSGKSLHWLARDDKGCRADDGCPDAEYLARRGVYVTKAPELVLERVAARTDRDRDLHEATIVLLDPEGRRIGESAFSVDFEVRGVE